MKNPVIEMASTDNIKKNSTIKMAPTGNRPLKWSLRIISTDYIKPILLGSEYKSTVLFIKSAFNTSIFTISPSLYIFFVCSPII